MFGSQTVYNVHGSSADKRKSNWCDAYFTAAKEFAKCGKCYTETESPLCGHTNNLPGDKLQGYIVGGQLWSPALKEADKGLYYYILPICKTHNKQNIYDGPPYSTGWLKTTLDVWALKVTSTSAVPGWKDMKQQMEGFKPITLTKHKDEAGADAAGKGEAKKSEAKEGEDGECHEVIPPEELTKWLLEEVHKIALEFAKDLITTVFKEVAAAVMGKLQDIIKAAGDAAVSWAKSEGHDIMLQSLIPLYGLYQAIKRLSSLKSDAMNRFHSEAQSQLADYRQECQGDAEQARRKQLLIDETNKVIASTEWQDRMVTFESTVASKIPEFYHLTSN